MKKYILSLLIVLLCSLVLFGCANKSYVRQDTSFTPHGWKQVVVLPFSGSRGFTDLATETFTLHMVGQKHFQIVQPQTAQVSINKLGIVTEGNTITILQAQRVAEVLNAQAVIIGNIESYKNGATLNAFSTVKVVDVSSGQIVAASHHPSGLLMAYSEQQCVIASVEKVANDINKFLLDAARKNISTEGQEIKSKRNSI